MTDGGGAPDIAGPLLDHLRGHLGRSRLGYAEPPVRLFGAVPYDSARGAANVTELLGTWGVRVALR